jgi:hypothetical protein
VLSSFELPSQGQFQTFNARRRPDVRRRPRPGRDDNLDTALSWQLSYGNPLDEGRSIIDAASAARRCS